jgi:beta-barrel assembly-enhancing protease
MNTDLHPQAIGDSLQRNRLTRRQAMWLFGASTSVAGVTSLQGCAKSPVTGERILVGMSESQERQVDAQQAPHQFSQDLGAVQDGGINQYVSSLGQRMQGNTQRPQMPYSYRVLNANYVNAYTFPAGAMGVTRGIMTEMQSEAELAALLGHEMGHVNARHAAQRQGQGLLAQVAVVGIGVATADSEWGGLANIASQVGASALLASYSRENEREADALGQDYMVKAGYPASGMTGLHQLLLKGEKAEPSMLATMFSSHPMTSERVANAEALARSRYAASLSANPQRERFMDSTASLRRIKPTIEACQKGETALSKKDLRGAEGQFATALRATPQDYAALRYAESARAIYPTEAQAQKFTGVLKLQGRDPAGALDALNRFDQLLPGDPGTWFLRGVALEGLGQRQQAAQQFNAFLQAGAEGNAAKYSFDRLKAWGYVK